MQGGSCAEIGSPSSYLVIAQLPHTMQKRVDYILNRGPCKTVSRYQRIQALHCSDPDLDAISIHRSGSCVGVASNLRAAGMHDSTGYL